MKQSHTTGYICFLKATERTQIQRLVKREIQRITKQLKNGGFHKTQLIFMKMRKKHLAQICSKLEDLHPLPIEELKEAV